MIWLIKKQANTQGNELSKQQIQKSTEVQLTLFRRKKSDLR